MDKESFFKSAYGKISLMLILLLTASAAMCMGSTQLTLSELVGGALRREGFETQSIILYNVRLPRILGAVVAGVGLSVSGVLLQSATGNSLASPNIIGVNAGAGFAVILAMYFTCETVYAMPLIAFAGAFLTTLFIVGVASRAGISRSVVILAGVAVTALLNAGISFVSYLDSDLLSSYNYFSVGGLSGVGTDEIIIPSVIIGAGLLLSVCLSEKIDTLYLGDGIAMSLGINAKKMRMCCLVIASACAAAVVSFAGLLGFVGLVVPHIARKLVGCETHQLLTVSALVGSILMICADLAGRVVFAPSEIPVGIVTALIGAPFFFCLLIRRKNHAEF